MLFFCLQTLHIIIDSPAVSLLLSVAVISITVWIISLFVYKHLQNVIIIIIQLPGSSSFSLSTSVCGSSAKKSAIRSSMDALLRELRTSINARSVACLKRRLLSLHQPL